MIRRIKQIMHALSAYAGSVWSFIAAIIVVLGWLVLGPLYGFSDTWQLVINTFTTIVTFLVAFSIQYSQNRDTKEIKAKLKEILGHIKQD